MLPIWTSLCLSFGKALNIFFFPNILFDSDRTTKFKAFAGDEIIPTQKLKFVLAGVENIVGKGENAGYQAFFSRDVKSRDCVVKG